MVDSRMRTIHHDVAIIGGGLVGAWTAYFLRKRGRSVAVLEKGAVGSQASGVNFGNVRLQGRHPDEFPLALRAHAQWERIAELIGEQCEFSPAATSISRSTRRSCRGSSATSVRVRPAGSTIALINPTRCAENFPGSARTPAARPGRGATAPPIRGLRHRRSHARRVRLGPNLSRHARCRDRSRGRTLPRRHRPRPCGRGAIRRQRGGRVGQRDRRNIRRDHADFPAAPPNFVTEPLPHFIHAALQAVDGSVIFRQVERGNVIVGFYPRGPADRAAIARRCHPPRRCLDLPTWRAWCRCCAARR